MVCYRTKLGEAHCGDAIELIDLCLEDNSVDLMITSPPFALQRQKAYGNLTGEEYVDWLCKFMEKMMPKLKDTGSIVLDLGGAYVKGAPEYSLYQFEVLMKLCKEAGYKLCEPFYWNNTSALPAPIEWVNKRKLRAKNSVNTIWWLSKNPRIAKANVSNVLMPYSERMKNLIQTHGKGYLKADGIETRPSGHTHRADSWAKDNHGAIPGNILNIPNSESNSLYLRGCKAAGVKGHPARFPLAIPEFFIKFLTDENDLVVDIFTGSNTTGQACEQLGRRWKSFELSQEYVAASAFRFIDVSEAADVYDRIMHFEQLDFSDKQLRI